MKNTVDRNGKSVAVGDRVTIVSIAAGDIDFLPEDERSGVLSMIGLELEVYEIDEYGQAWVEMQWAIGPGEIESHALGLAPNEMELQLS